MRTFKCDISVIIALYTLKNKQDVFVEYKACGLRHLGPPGQGHKVTNFNVVHVCPKERIACQREKEGYYN